MDGNVLKKRTKVRRIDRQGKAYNILELYGKGVPLIGLGKGVVLFAIETSRHIFLCNSLVWE